MENNRNNFFIASSNNGIRKTNAGKGIHRIDFEEGKYFDQADTETILNNSLKNSSFDYVRSVMIWSSSSAKITIGESQPQEIFHGAGSWTKLSNIRINKLSVEILSTNIPDENVLYIVGFTSREPFHESKFVDIREDARVSAKAITDSDVAIIEKRISPYYKQTLVITESGTTNGLTYTIQVKNHGDATYKDLQVATALSASATDIVQIEGTFHSIKLLAKNTVGGNNAEITTEWRGFS